MDLESSIMIYPGDRPRMKARIKFKAHSNPLLDDGTKGVAKALQEKTDKASMAQTSAFLEEESIVTHQGKEYRCTVVRLYAPVQR